MARARLAGSGLARPLDGTWAITAVAPGRARCPADLAHLASEWIPCDGPMPVAAVLREAGRWDLNQVRDFDANDWWYRCRFAAPGPARCWRLLFEGLATVADAWLNGTHILRSESMFVANAIDVSSGLRAENELVLCFHAIGPLLDTRRPRPKWRTRLTSSQQLRWHRTSLLGRMPAWCPPVAPVGPWRPVLIEPGPLHVDQSNLRAVLDGDDGVLWISILTAALPTLPTRGTVTVGERGEWSAPVAIERTDDGRAALQAIVRVPDVECWWPHTHGPQPLYPVRVSLDVEANPTTVDLGRVGFRDLEIERGGDGDGFGLRVNGVDVFCRGVCWTPLDISALDAGADQYRSALEQLRDAGVNMIRVGGTMVYETDAFYDLCDELGIFVWQDFMFANMDYPSADKAFTAAVSREARQLLRRLQARPSIAVLCGSSEVDQQCAMLGLPAERSKNPLFDELLPALVASFIPDAAWLRSTPSGGTFPFQADRGVSHYYGVGAYLKPFDDARRANVRFASECLAFSNVPDAAMVDRLLAEGAAPGHHPRWKAGVPRDAGAGWDFEDVRDHYLRLLFGLEPAALRANDIDRYLALGRVATAEAMLRTFAEWRRPGSPCRGGLVWFARDLVAGAGWGIVDSEGRPKAAYWYLKRALAPVTLLASDEGLNGLWLHAVNDTSMAVDAEIHVAAYRDGRPRGARASTAVRIPARGARSVHADALFGEGFLDLTYAYRFGPPGHDVVAATLRARATGAILAAAHGFPCGLPAGFDGALRLTARTEPIADGYVVTVGADRFAHAVAIDAEGFEPDDNYFHLEPGQERQIVLHATAPDLPLRGSVRALNGAAAVPITVTASLGVRRAL